MKGVRIGNAVLDGEVVGKSWRMALEIKSTRDDVIRGIGQLVEALSQGYQSAALVTSLQRAKHLDKKVFENGLVLLGVDSEAGIHQVYP
jgi:F0F1-type ATP synthase membrane subunit c/vacuolar-type H+-ATPase subunit K